MTDEEVRAKGFHPYLRPEHVNEGDTLKLTGFNRKKEQGTAREQIVCEVEDSHGQNYDLGVRVGSPDHRVLHKALGPKWEEWAGSVTVTLRDGTQGVKFVNVSEASSDDPPF